MYYKGNKNFSIIQLNKMFYMYVCNSYGQDIIINVVIL